MNILFINEADCCKNIAGGITRVNQLLSEYFTSHNHSCFLGYFINIEGEPLPFQNRIQLTVPFDDTTFEEFLLANHINIIIYTIWWRKHLSATEHIFRIASAHHIKVLYEVHVSPGHELKQFTTLEQLLFSLHHHKNIKEIGKKWLISKIGFLLKPLLNKLLGKKYFIPYHHSDRVIVLSQHYIPKYAQLIGVKDTTKIQAIENALTYDFFATENEIQSKKKEVVIVGRLSEYEKRISLALKIWKLVEQDPQLTDWTLTLVGDGTDKDYYEYLIQKSHLKCVSLVGEQAPLEYYKRASILLLTSTAEGWPMVLMEAAQMGVPCVAFDSFDALHEIVTDGRNGVIVPNNNIKLFYEKLADLMLDDAKREQMALAAIEDSKRFTKEKIMPKWDALLKEISSESPAEQD